jgi:hypothetical protein
MPQRQTRPEPAPIPRPPERRRHIRQLALLRVAVLHAGGSSDICVVKNVSPDGLSARVYRTLGPGAEVTIEFRSGESVVGNVVWEAEREIGIVFPEPIDVSAVLASHSASDSARRRALPRIMVECPGQLNDGLRSIHVQLRDISQSGASVVVANEMLEMGKVRLLLPDLAPIEGVVRWTSGTAAGLSFNECLAFEDLARWIQVRREGPWRGDELAFRQRRDGGRSGS